MDVSEDFVNDLIVSKSQVADKKVEVETKMRREERVSRENVSTSVPGTGVSSEEYVVFLKEMFPDLLEETLRSIYSQCRGDMDTTIQRLLQLAEEEREGEKQQSATVPSEVYLHRYTLEQKKVS